MLKNIDPLLTPDLLHVLASMGHGDDLAIVDANHPATTVASETTTGILIRLPGVSMEHVVSAILSVFPIDTFVEDPLRCMEVVGSPEEIPEVRAAVQNEIAGVADYQLSPIERFAFYEAAKASFAVVQVGDSRPYGCFIFKKGVLP